MSRAATAAERGRAATRSGPGLRDNLVGWAFALPFVAVFVAFMAGPILASFLLSFTDFTLRDLRDPFGTEWVGLSNYTSLLEDEKFISSAFNTAYFVVVGVPLTLALGLLIAVAVNQGISRLKALFRVGYYLPVVTSIVAIAVVWRYVLQPDLGLMNSVLGAVGLEGQNWLGDPNLAMPSIIAIAVWRNIGYTMVIFLAGLQGIDHTLYEAAKMDGANALQQFRNVTLPLLRPTSLFAAVITTIGYLQVFEEPFVMTGGGPLDRTLTVSMYLYQQGFNFFNQGYASAIAYVLFVTIVLLAVVQFRLLRPQT